MSADSSEQSMEPPAQLKLSGETCYLRITSNGHESRGSVIILIFFCHFETLFDNNLFFLFSSFSSLYILAGVIHSLEIGGHGFKPKEFSA